MAHYSGIEPGDCGEIATRSRTWTRCPKPVLRPQGQTNCRSPKPFFAIAAALGCCFIRIAKPRMPDAMAGKAVTPGGKQTRANENLFRGVRLPGQKPNPPLRPRQASRLRSFPARERTAHRRAFLHFIKVAQRINESPSLERKDGHVHAARHDDVIGWAASGRKAIEGQQLLIPRRHLGPAQRIRLMENRAPPANAVIPAPNIADSCESMTMTTTRTLPQQSPSTNSHCARSIPP
jgi:hypothetical protein